MDSRHDSAYPNGGFQPPNSGMTIRDIFTLHAMEGLIASGYSSNIHIDIVARKAVEIADAVLDRMGYA